MNAMQLTTKLVDALDPAIQEARDEAGLFKQLKIKQLVNLQATVRDRERDLKDRDWEIRNFKTKWVTCEAGWLRWNVNMIMPEQR